MLQATWTSHPPLCLAWSQETA